MKQNGFTLIEVMIALAIVGASLGVFMSILGNSLRTRWKLEDHAKNVIAARVTAEKLGLGLLEDSMEGETENGTHWEVTPVSVAKRLKNEDGIESPFMSKSDYEDMNKLIYEELSIPEGQEDQTLKKTRFYNVMVGGIELSAAGKGVRE